jgi:hypothetical protein
MFGESRLEREHEIEQNMSDYEIEIRGITTELCEDIQVGRRVTTWGNEAHGLRGLFSS